MRASCWPHKPGEQSVQPLCPVSAPTDAKSTANSGATPPAGIGAKQHHIYYSRGNAQSTRQAMRWPVRARRGKPSPGEQSVQSLGPVFAPSDDKTTANSGATPPAALSLRDVDALQACLDLEDMAARAFRRKLRGDKWRRRREHRRLVRLLSQQRDPLIMQQLLMSVKLQLQMQALRHGAAELDRNAIAQAAIGSKWPSQ